MIHWTKPRLAALLPLYAAIATALGFVDYHVRPFPNHAYESYIPEVTHGTAPPPARYRVLGPAAASSLQRLTRLPPDDAWIIFRWLSIFACLCAGHVWYGIWFSTAGSLAGNALVTALLPLTFTNSWGHPDHVLELCLFTIGCACVARQWNRLFLVVLAAAALNRETSFLLVIIFAVAEPPSRARLRWIGAAALLWAIIYVGLRWRLGYVAYNPLHFRENLAFLLWWPAGRDLYYRLYSWFFLILLVGPAALIIGSWSAQPRMLRRSLAVTVPVLVAIGVTFSSILEPRIFTPLMPLLVAGTLTAVFRTHEPIAVGAGDRA